MSTAGLHHLSDQESDHGRLAAVILLDLFWIGREHLRDNLLERTGIGDLPQTFALYDDGRRLAALKHLGKNIFGKFAGEVALIDQLQPIRPDDVLGQATRPPFLPAALSRPIKSPTTQLAVVRPSPLTLAAASK